MQITVNQNEKAIISIRDDVVIIKICSNRQLKQKPKRKSISEIARSIPAIPDRAPIITIDDFEKMIEDMKEKDEY